MRGINKPVYGFPPFCLKVPNMPLNQAYDLLNVCLPHHIVHSYLLFCNIFPTEPDFCLATLTQPIFSSLFSSCSGVSSVLASFYQNMAHTLRAKQKCIWSMKYFLFLLTSLGCIIILIIMMMMIKLFYS